nr:beta galactosidase jelly roll domain-containing protein [Clostridia bacterium]
MKKIYNSIPLNGTWAMDYAPEAYTSAELPQRKYAPVEGAVPGYWEDMTEKFRKAPFFCFLQVNPEYGVQRYPIVGTCPDMALPNITGNFFYTRTFVCDDDDCATTPAALSIEGAQNAVSAWINGTYIGRHEGYSAPFEMIIPEGILVKGENTVVMSVSNIRLKGYNNEPVSGVTSRAACECTGGIYGDVEIRLYKSALRDVYVTTEADLTAVTMNIVSTEPVTYTWTLLDGKKVLRTGEATGSAKLNANDLEKWSPDNPKLYTLRISDGEYTIERRFGVRRLTVDGVHLRLNGEYICPRGICEHGYFPLTAHPCRDKNYYRKIVKTLKKLGFNFVRFHTHIPMPEYLEA